VILVTGATGFVGTRVVHLLRVTGQPVRCLVRDRARAETLRAWGCEIAVGDMRDADSLRTATQGCEAVVHLVSILAGRPQDFALVMREGTRSLAAAAHAEGVRRLVLMSALGVDAPGADRIPYYEAKQAMEETFRGAGPTHVVIRPSFVFGRDGGALPRFARIVRMSPLVVVPGPGTQRIQPVWVDDVARAVTLSLSVDESFTLEIGGPDVVTWNELWRRIALRLGKRRRLVHLPVAALRPGAALAERLPGPPLTRDQLSMLELEDNVVGDGGAGMAKLGLTDLLTLDGQLRRGLAG
jgi:uncharacterized protein YbjT (DUF2867 family)